VVYRQAASTRGQRIEVLTIDSNISTGSFRNATDDSLTYQIKGQEKTVARGDSPPGPGERFANSKRGLLWAAILGGAATTVRLAIKTPVLMLDGTADQQVPYSQTLEMAEALQKSQKEYTADTFKDAGPRPDGKRRERANERSLRFLRAHLSSTQRGREHCSMATGMRDMRTGPHPIWCDSE